MPFKPQISEPAVFGMLDLDLENVPTDPEKAVVEVLGVPQGFCLVRLSVFRELPPPWFVTKENYLRNRRDGATQDLYFSLRCVQAGKRLGIDRRVIVGHKGADGVVY